ncbi:hypothetical protein LTS15_000452 [Exophiala xenobiotica]|nr:hypothetical protein LTS15_000452 [Exophiala xenobiotica]
MALVTGLVIACLAAAYAAAVVNGDAGQQAGGLPKRGQLLQDLIGDSWKGTPGEVVVEGVFTLDKFFSIASEAGIYVIARPGPYINTETADLKHRLTYRQNHLIVPGGRNT